MIKLSAEESKKLGVLVARGDRVPSIDVAALRKTIYENEFDFCRIKVPSTDEQTLEQLRELSMPWFIHSILVRNSIDLNTEQPDNRLLRLEFKKYTSDQADILEDIVRRSWGSRTAINYSDPVYRSLVDTEKELEAAAAYALGFDEAKQANARCWMFYKEDEPIGFVCGLVEEDGLEGIMYSIVPEHRGDRLAADIMLFLKRACLGEGLRYFRNDVPYQNMPSLKSIVRESIGPVGTYLNITINSLLTATVLEPESHPLAGCETKTEIIRFIADHMHLSAGAGLLIKEFKSDLADINPKDDMYLTIHTPYKTRKEAQLVAKITLGSKLVGTAYGWYVAV